MMRTEKNIPLKTAMQLLNQEVKVYSRFFLNTSHSVELKSIFAVLLNKSTITNNYIAVIPQEAHNQFRYEPLYKRVGKNKKKG